MVEITGKYLRISEEKFEDFLTKLEMDFFTRKAAMASTPKMEITKTGDKWKFVTSTIMKKMTLEFELVSIFKQLRFKWLFDYILIILSEH